MPGQNALVPVGDVNSGEYVELEIVTGDDDKKEEQKKQGKQKGKKEKVKSKLDPRL